jgi:phosphatidylserine decarboxylase
MFHLGSTVILLFEPGRVRLDTAAGQTLRVGERINGLANKQREFAA